MVALKNVRDKKQFMFPGIQVYTEDIIGLYNAYLDATQEPHGYLLLDLTQDTVWGFKTTYSCQMHIPSQSTLI